MGCTFERDGPNTRSIREGGWPGKLTCLALPYAPCPPVACRYLSTKVISPVFLSLVGSGQSDGEEDEGGHHRPTPMMFEMRPM